MYVRKGILRPLHTAGTPEGTPAGAGQGTTDNGAGAGTGTGTGGSGGSSSTTNDAKEGNKPAGYVPVGELAVERAKRHEFEQKFAQQEAANKAQLDGIAKALGLKSADTPEQLQAQLAEKDATAKQAQAALSVYDTAADAGGDPRLLLDSASFLAKLKTIDPNNKDAVKAAITEAVAANPALAGAKVTPAGSGDAGAGSGGGNKAAGINDAIRALAGH